MDSNPTNNSSERPFAEAPSPNGHDSDRKLEDPTVALTNLLGTLTDVFANSIQYLGARVDLAKLSVKGLIAEIMLGFLTFFVLGISLGLCVAYILYGIGQGVSDLFGLRDWAGLALTGIFFFIAILTFFSISQKRREKKRVKSRLQAQHS